VRRKRLLLNDVVVVFSGGGDLEMVSLSFGAIGSGTAVVSARNKLVRLYLVCRA
jgi:hypothetical protein